MMKTLYATLILTLVAAQATLVLPRSDEKADQILANMHARSKNLTTFQASIVQLKRSTQIPGKGQIFTGQLSFRHHAPNKDKLRMTYKRGEEVTNDLLIDGDKVTLYQPVLNQAIIKSRSKLAQENPEYDFLAAPYGSVSGLKASYSISYQREEAVGAFSTSVIQLVPLAKSSFTRVTIWVDRASWFPVQYQVDQVNGDITILTLSAIKKDSKVPSDAFDLHPPKGTDIIK
jgi:outer membrane lipoprotein-sorting protein